MQKNVILIMRYTIIMEKYYKYKHIFSGVATVEDVIFLRNKCPKEDYELIDCITRSLELQPCISNVKMNNIVDTLTGMRYKEDCKKYLDGLDNMKKYTYFEQSQSNYCMAQTEAFGKIIATKSLDDTYIDLPKIEKKCPHCGRLNKAPFGTKYIVCGIDTMGVLPINNFGNTCLNDWCFLCGKKLCKHWYTHQLYDEFNRKHDNTCCANHATQNNFRYPDDYCQCTHIRQQTIEDIMLQ
jgi:hypothetical protein